MFFAAQEAYWNCYNAIYIGDMSNRRYSNGPMDSKYTKNTKGSLVGIDANIRYDQGTTSQPEEKERSWLARAIKGLHLFSLACVVFSSIQDNIHCHLHGMHLRMRIFCYLAPSGTLQSPSSNVPSKVIQYNKHVSSMVINK